MKMYYVWFVIKVVMVEEDALSVLAATTKEKTPSVVHL